MLLAIDIGNSTIGLGLFPEPGLNNRVIIEKIPTYPLKPPEAFNKIIRSFMRRNTVTAPGRPRIRHKTPLSTVEAVIASVVPAANKALIRSLKELYGTRPIMVKHTGLAFSVREPEKVGADRIANAVAVSQTIKGPAAIVDFGTATTISVVDGRGVFIGGAIMPGVELMKKALCAGTARLPDAPLRARSGALGKDTASAISLGIISGTAKAVEGLLKDMEKGLGFKLKLFLTGGHAALMSPVFNRRHRLVFDLTFQGMRLIYLKEK
jgi:type III pantothenate kinase